MKKLISVKLDPPLLEWLDKKAKQENRPRNNLIETFLISMYETYENKSYSKTIGRKST